MKIKFKDIQHKEFFLKMQRELESMDSYHSALFYCLGISADCRQHIADIVTWDKEAHISPETAFSGGWQTSSSQRCIRLAFNLFNGYTDSVTNPYDLFCDSDATYYQEAVKIRYPEYLEEKHQYCITDGKHILQESIPEFLAESYLSMWQKQHPEMALRLEEQQIYTLDI